MFLLAGALITARPVRAADGATLFVKNCASCHGADGKAQTPAGKQLGARDLALSRIPDATIERQITVGGKEAGGSGKMPAFKARLTSEEIKTLVAYVKSLRR
jgi:mono/diheme cytochrome c family protein